MWQGGKVILIWIVKIQPIQARALWAIPFMGIKWLLPSSILRMSSSPNPKKLWISHLIVNSIIIIVLLFSYFGKYELSLLWTRTEINFSYYKFSSINLYIYLLPQGLHSTIDNRTVTLDTQRGITYLNIMTEYLLEFSSWKYLSLKKNFAFS